MVTLFDSFQMIHGHHSTALSLTMNSVFGVNIRMSQTSLIVLSQCLSNDNTGSHPGMVGTVEMWMGGDQLTWMRTERSMRGTIPTSLQP
jgi:hypothetical protein